MKNNSKRVLCYLLAAMLCISMTAPAVHAENGLQLLSAVDGMTDPGDGSDPSDPGDGSDPSDSGDGSDPSNPSDGSDPSDPSGGTDPSDSADTEYTMSFVIGDSAHMFGGGKPVTATAGTEIDLDDAHYAPRRDGYAFYGWYTDEACVEQNITGVHTLDADITLYAKWVQMTAPTHHTVVGDIARGRYTGDAYSDAGQPNFIKISHPYYPVNSNRYNPADIDPESPEFSLHSYEVFNDGLLDYLGRLDGKDNAPGKGQPNQVAASGAPFFDMIENQLGGVVLAEGQGDRGMSYSWSGQGYGDWMYVTLQFNPTGQTGQMMDVTPDDEQTFRTFGGDYFTREPDHGDPGCALCKINVKTGEVRVIMSTAKNRLNTQFRNSIPFKGKLYFCGSVNHMPSIYEIDPETDAFQCVYQDESMVTFPGGMGAAWAEAQKTHLCPAIRGMTTFKLEDQEYLVISCVGMDANPYIAVSADPSSGHFTKIAYNFEPDTDNTVPGELRGYAACHLTDAIFGGSIWEMAQVGNKLYVALCTGTPDNAEYNRKGEMISMQSFALIEGVLREGGRADNRADWTWNVIAGDQERDNAPYTFGFDPERTRAGACNLQVFNGDLYIGEYNDNQIGFKNLNDSQFEFIIRNMDQSISLYRLNHETHAIELVMGTPTKLFPKPVATITESETNLQRDLSGFGRRENQYIWQSKVFDGKMYLGTMDVTALLTPLGRRIAEQNKPGGKKMAGALDALLSEAEQAAAVSTFADGENVYQDLLDMREFYEDRKSVSTMADFAREYVTDPFVPLPTAVFEAPVMISVDSPDTLYAAMLAISDILRLAGDWSEQEAMLSQLRLAKQAEAVFAYVDSTDDEVPAALLQTVETFRKDESYTKIKNLETMLRYLENAIAGFDLLVTENGVDFQAVTRTGMGDPYNSGLRVFATNVKEDEQQTNPWMTIGSANQFYGTQIWRMENGNLNTGNVSGEKMYVEVRFIDENGSRILPATESDIGRATTLHVDASRTTIDLETIENIYPDGALPVENTPASFRIQGEAGSRYIEVPVLKAYSLRFAVNGGHRIRDVKVPAGTTIDLTAADYLPEKEDSVFGGWFTDPKCPGENRVTEIVMDGHKVVYAKWEAVRHTLSFETNGGSELSPVTAVENTEIDLRSYLPERQGYSFGGWYLDEGLTEPAETVKLTQDMTVYARWTAQRYTLRFATNGGTPIESVSALAGSLIELKDYTTVREGYTFDGWFLDTAFERRVEAVILAGNLTIYAKWTQTEVPTEPSEPSVPSEPTVPSVPTEPVTFSLRFETNGGSALESRTVAEGTVVDLTGLRPARSGYTFAGWYEDSELTRAVTSVTVTGDTTVYAKWDKKVIANPFVDVKPDDYFYDAVLWAVDSGITAGVSANQFGPLVNCTRSQAMTFLWRAAGAPDMGDATNPFKDVHADDYFYDAVLWAVENDITAGSGPDTFGPLMKCTRSQIVTFLWRLADSPDMGDATNPFKDVHADDYFYDAVLWAVENGITAGSGPDTFGPLMDCTRSQIVTFLYRYAGN